MDGAGNAIELAGPAFHADLRPGQYGHAAIHLEGRVRTDIRAQAATVAKFRLVNQGVL
jgi:hypothetical protein